MTTFDDFNEIESEMASKEDMMKRLEEESQVFRNSRIKEAFQKVDRKNFVPLDYIIEAYEDYALPLGFGATISQPTTVAYMLELLNPEKEDRVLDVGSGSGFTTALLAEMVGKEGKVIAFEIIPELVEYAKTNLLKYSYSNVEIKEGKEGSFDISNGPFDKILVSAGAEEIPEDLIEGLKDGGVMVMPIRNKEGNFSIVRVEKRDGEIEQQSYPGFMFVDLQ